MYEGIFLNMKLGYGFDVNLFAVGAVSGETLCSSDGGLTAIPVFDRLQNDRGLLCDGTGALYRVTTPGEVLGGELFLRQSYDRPPCPFAYPWLGGEEISDLCPMVFDAAYITPFAELLERITDTSPVGKVYVQIRCQGLELSSICGTWTPGRFMERIVCAGHLWGNMTYILAKNADEPQDDIVNRN